MHQDIISFTGFGIPIMLTAPLWRVEIIIPPDARSNFTVSLKDMKFVDGATDKVSAIISEVVNSVFKVLCDCSF